MSLLWKEVADFGLRVTILGLNCPTKSKRIERKGCGACNRGILEKWNDGKTLLRVTSCGLRVTGCELRVPETKGVRCRGWGVGRKTWKNGILE